MPRRSPATAHTARILLATALTLAPAPLLAAGGSGDLPAARAGTATRAQTGMAADAWSYCRTAAGKIERARNLPPALLQAMTLVETGRRGPDGAHTAWPWTINAGGRGYHFASKREAVWAVRRLMADGVQSIDVGCMQVNLRYHPRAFTSLEEAFDPMANMAYAASFLSALHARHGDWRAATARYHSYNPALREKYAARVDATLARERKAMAAADTAAPQRAAPAPAAGGGHGSGTTRLAGLGLRPTLIPGLRRSLDTAAIPAPHPAHTHAHTERVARR